MDETIPKVIDTLKTPKGVIKILLFVLSILAFATTTSFSSSSILDISCKEQNKTRVISPTMKITYPFDLNANHDFHENVCDKTSKKFTFYGSYMSKSQFYVFVGVISMLISALGFVAYIIGDKFTSEVLLFKADLYSSVVMAVLTFIAACAWADGVRDMKTYTDPSRLKIELKHIKGNKLHLMVNKLSPEFAGLNISLIFGFTLFAVWASSIWFTYKDVRDLQDPIIMQPESSLPRADA